MSQLFYVPQNNIAIFVPIPPNELESIQQNPDQSLSIQPIDNNLRELCIRHRDSLRVESGSDRKRA